MTAATYGCYHRRRRSTAANRAQDLVKARSVRTPPPCPPTSAAPSPSLCPSACGSRAGGGASAGGRSEWAEDGSKFKVTDVSTLSRRLPP